MRFLGVLSLSILVAGLALFGLVSAFAQTVQTPTVYTNQDVGVVKVPGAAVSDASGVLTLTAAGTDFWGAADSGFVSVTTASGDCTLIARALSVSNTNPWTKAGLTLRGSLSASSAHASFYITPGNGLAFQFRATDGAVSTSISCGSYTTPVWLRLQKSGTLITASRSDDGVNWTVVQTQTLTLPTSLFAGVALTSHNANAAATAQLDSLSLSASGFAPVPSPWSYADLGTPTVRGFTEYASSSGTFAAYASGADIWGTADSGHFISQMLVGDGEIVTRVVTQQNTNAWAKAGLMVRESLDANARNVALLASPGNGWTFQWRSAVGGASSNISSGAAGLRCRVG